jgi:hypothetical protein
VTPPGQLSERAESETRQPRVTDIFMSYSSADRPRAKALAEELENIGFHVWWDREIPLGRAYSEVIPEELQKARCVLVLWSKQSIQSRWVYEEAVKGRERNVLIPARIEDTELPMGFALLQAAELTDWEPGEPHAGFDQLVDSIGRLLGSAPTPSPGAASTGRSPRQKAMRRALWLGLPAGVIGLAAIALTYWHLPTRIQLDLLVDRVVFTLGGSGQTPLVEPMSFRSLVVEHFQSLSFEPRRLEVADPAKYDEERREYAPGAWQPVPTSGAVTFSPKDPTLRPSVSIQTTSDEGDLAGKLDRLSVGTGARVTLETGRGKPPRVAVTIDGPQADVTVTPRGEFRLVANHVSLSGVVRLPVESDSLEFKAELKPGNLTVGVLGEPQSLSLKLRPAAAAEVGFLSPGGTPVTAIDFLRPQPDAPERAWEPSQVADGSLAYPDDHGVPDIKILRDDFIGLQGLDPCSIQSLSIDPEQQAMRMRLDCKARAIKVRSGGFTREHTLTAMERLWHSSMVAVLIAMVVAGLSAAASGYELLRSWRGSR